jgi:uncharacterized protein YecE (DUF72 family)
MSRVLLGTSGFSYADWKGHFYPPGTKPGQMLPFYARVFPTVEINATYYRPPTAATMFGMMNKVPEGFEFVVKAHQDMTHSGEFIPEAFAQFREALAPLTDSGMLGCILAQFPWGFRRTPENEEYLARLRDGLEDLPVVVEFRNAEWVADEVFSLLSRLGLGFCSVDEPRLKGLLPPIAVATAPIGYVRFHGRNAKQWWRHEESWQRYNYLYTKDELREWVPKVEQIAADTDKTFLFFNNHYEGQAAQNARQMAQLLNLELPLELPTQPTLL